MKKEATHLMMSISIGADKAFLNNWGNVVGGII